MSTIDLDAAMVEAEKQIAAERTPPLSAFPHCPQRGGDWPVPGVGAFYGLPGGVVRVLGEESEADPMALLLTFLTAFGAAVGRGPHALADGAEHAGRLFTVLVGDSSKARKGTSWSQVRRVLVAADRRFVDDRVLGGFGSGEALVDAVADESDHRLLVVEPEWARVLSVGRRDGGTLSPILRQAWDGDKLAVRSRGSGSVVAEGGHMALLGHVTVEELRAKLCETEVANGYANRHLFALVRRGRLLPSGGNLDDQQAHDLGRQTRDALDAARKVGTMRRTPEAEKRWAQLYYVMADDDPGGLLGAVIARDAAQVLRLSIIYALTDGSLAIDVPHLEAAWAIWSYCRRSAEQIFGSAMGDPLTDKLITALRAAGPDGLDGRQIDRALGGHATAAEVKVTVDRLIRTGRAISFTEETGGRPRRVLVAAEHADNAEMRTKGLAR